MAELTPTRCGNECVSLHRPVLYLFRAALHCGSLLFRLNHQALKQPLLVLQGLPDLHHSEHMRDHSIHQSGSSRAYSLSVKKTKHVSPRGTGHYAGDLRGNYCTETFQKTKAYEYLIGIRRAKDSVCRYR